MMEYKNTIVLSISLVLILLFVVYLILPFGKNEKFKKGAKSNAPDFLINSATYKRKLFTYRIFRILSVLSLSAFLLACAYLAARPYVTEVTEEPLYGRDIYLCMDISSSVDTLNEKLVSELKSIVDASDGDRFGIIIFNSSPVILCPLTTDYSYVNSTLDQIRDCIRVRKDPDSLDKVGLSDYLVSADYISAGTLVDSDTRGSSLIGDGLAYCSVAFSDMEKDRNRVRLVIFTTDNDLQGEPLCTLSDAGKLCKNKSVKVYGIGTELMNQSSREEMKDAVTSTGGKFYLEEESIQGIIRDIDQEGKSLLITKKNVTEHEIPERSFIALVISAACFFLFMRLSKR